MHRVCALLVVASAFAETHDLKLTPENVHWVGSYLAFPGRIDREEWIAQATELAKGGETAFSKRVERGEVASSQDHGTSGQDNVADLSKIKPHE